MRDERRNPDRLPQYTPPPQKGPEEDEEETPMGAIGIGFAIIVIGILGYFLFKYIEENGGGRMPIIFWAAFKLLGKFGILYVCSGIGVLIILIGVVGLIRGKM